MLPEIEDWQNHPLDEAYPILYIDAIHYLIRDNGVIQKLEVYVTLEINSKGKKKVLCADGLTGIKEAIEGLLIPKTEYQRCIVHQVRNTLKYVPDKERKAFAADLKTIYQESDEKKALAALERIMEKWTSKYLNSMKRWSDK